jgi:TRAP-type C4-dicarboxylate transport system substrate-binding protein
MAWCIGSTYNKEEDRKMLNNSKLGILVAAAVMMLLVITIGIFRGMNEACATESSGVTLKIATHITPGYRDAFNANKRMVDYVNSFGKQYNMNAEFYHSGTVYKAKDLLPACSKGTIDIVLTLAASYIEGSVPGLGATALPFMWQNPYVHRFGTKRGTAYFKFVNQQFERLGIMLLGLTDGSVIEFISTKPLRKLEDWSGLKIRVAGASYAKAMQALGAAPVTMPSGEVYTSLQRGVVDAAHCPDITIQSRRLYEIAKYQTNLGCFVQELTAFMNKAKFEKLSDDQKRVILNAATYWAHDTGGSDVFGHYLGMRYSAEAKHGVEQIYLSGTETARINKALRPVLEWWKGKVKEEIAKEAISSIKESQDVGLPNWGQIDLIMPEGQPCGGQP